MQRGLPSVLIEIFPHEFVNALISSKVLFLMDLQVVEDMSAVVCGKHWVGIYYKFAQPILGEEPSIFFSLT